MNRRLDNNLDGDPVEKPEGSSSYFDFVEQKAQEELDVSADESMDLEETGRDAFVVQVPDEQTAYKLKLKYFP